MAAGWPTKVTYANGDVFSASDINDTNGTLNYIDPTSATDNQVLTRDNAVSGKVKWANSPANTLTAKGDLYYASNSNTPARLPIGSTDQVLKVSGGVPTWATASAGAMTLIASNTITSGTTSVFSSIPNTYKTLKAIGKMDGGTNYFVEMNAGSVSCAGYRGIINTTPAWSLATNVNGYLTVGTGSVGWEANFYNYTDVQTTHTYTSYGIGTSFAPYVACGNITVGSAAAVSTLTFLFASGATGVISLYGIG
jgi:hypothetical protein